MAHNINIENGRASMFYVNETPWHKLGMRLPKLATTREAIEMAQLGYTVEKKRLVAVGNMDTLSPAYPVKDTFATVRMDNGKILGFVGNNYTVVQNLDAFSFFDSIVGEGEAMFETAGAIGAGQKIWILAKLPSFIRLRGDDIVDKYLLLSNSHDGSSTIRIKFTPIRVVCENTLNMALAGSRKDEVRIRHLPTAKFHLKLAGEIMGLSNEFYKDMDVVFNRMSVKSMTGDQLLKFVKTIVPNKKDALNHHKTEHARKVILDLHESGKGSEIARGTVWGAYNAVTEYVDHVLVNEGRASKPMDKRLDSMWFGTGAMLKGRAFKVALDLVKN